MKNKILSFAFVLAFVFGVALTATQNVNAQVASLPAGCTSTMGYSTTNGAPCNGTSTATVSYMAGCSSTLGYSTTNGLPCNGTTTASINYIAGCTSAVGYSTIDGLPCNGTFTATLSLPAGCSTIYGYSIVNGIPCNGTSTATPDPGTLTITTSGLPVTGAGGSAPLNAFLLLSSGILAAYGISRLVRNSKAAI